MPLSLGSPHLFKGSFTDVLFQGLNTFIAYSRTEKNRIFRTYAASMFGKTSEWRNFTIHLGNPLKNFMNKLIRRFNKLALKNYISAYVEKKDLYTVVGLKAGGILVSYIFMLAATSWYGADAWGRFTIGFACLQLIGILGKAGQDMVLINLLPPLHKGGDFHAIRVIRIKSLAFILLLGVILTFLLLTLKSPLNKLFFEKANGNALWYWVAAALIPFLVHEFQIESLRAMGHNILYALGKHLHYFGFGVVTLFICFKFANLDEPVLGAFTIGLIVSMIVATLFWSMFRPQPAYNHNPVSGSSPAWRTLLHMGWPFMVTSSITLLFGYIDTLMVGAYLGDAATGVYNAAVKISTVTTLSMTAAHTVQARRFSLYYHQGDYNGLEAYAKRITRWTFIFSFPVAIVLWYFPEYFLTVFNQSFARGATALRYLVIGHMISVSCGSVLLLLQFTNQQIAARNLAAIGTTLNLMLNVILIPFAGIQGAALSSMVGIAFINLGGIWLTQRQLGINTFLKI